MSKIILFPENRIVRKFDNEGKETSIEKIVTFAEKLQAYIEETLKGFKSQVFSGEVISEMLPNNPKAERDWALVEEAFRSFIYRFYDEPHFLQEYLDTELKNKVHVKFEQDFDLPDDDGPMIA